MSMTSPVSPPIPWRLSVRGGGRIVRLLGVMVVGVAGFAFHPSNRRTLAGRASWLQRNCRRCLRALNVTVTTTGTVPRGVLLTPNHVGYLDIILLSALAPTVFVSKSEVGGWPIFGWFAKRAGTRFLRRDLKADLVRVGGDLKPVIDAGVNLVIFLEGTSTEGKNVRRFKPSLLEPAVQEGWRVAPVALRYLLDAGDDPAIAVAWWGTMPLAPHLLTMAGLRSIAAQVAFGESEKPGNNRKELAGRMHEVVSAQVAAWQRKDGS